MQFELDPATQVCPWEPWDADNPQPIAPISPRKRLLAAYARLVERSVYVASVLATTTKKEKQYVTGTYYHAMYRRNNLVDELTGVRLVPVYFSHMKV